MKLVFSASGSYKLSHVVIRLYDVLKLLLLLFMVWIAVLASVVLLLPGALAHFWPGGALSGLLAWCVTSKNDYFNLYLVTSNKILFFLPEILSSWNKLQWISDSLSPVFRTFHNLTYSAYLIVSTVVQHGSLLLVGRSPYSFSLDPHSCAFMFSLTGRPSTFLSDYSTLSFIYFF